VLGPALGMKTDSDFDSIIRQYIDDELHASRPADPRRAR